MEYDLISLCKVVYVHIYMVRERARGREKGREGERVGGGSGREGGREGGRNLMTKGCPTNIRGLVSRRKSRFTY